MASEKFTYPDTYRYNFDSTSPSKPNSLLEYQKNTSFGVNSPSSEFSFTSKSEGQDNNNNVNNNNNNSNSDLQLSPRASTTNTSNIKNQYNKQDINFKNLDFTINNNMATLSISPSNNSLPQIIIPSSKNDTNPLDAMEKEQEGIVLKLMHEIQSLKDENKMLRNLLRSNSINSPPNSPASTSYSFQSSSTLSSNTPISINTTNSLPNSPFINQRRATITTIASMKRTPSLIPSNSISRSRSKSRSRSRSSSFSNSLKLANGSNSLLPIDPNYPHDNEYSILPQKSINSNINNRYPSFGSSNGGHSRNLSLISNLNNEEVIEDDDIEDETDNNNNNRKTENTIITASNNNNQGIGDYYKLSSHRNDEYNEENFKKHHKRSSSDNTRFITKNSSNKNEHSNMKNENFKFSTGLLISNAEQ